MLVNHKIATPMPMERSRPIDSGVESGKASAIDTMINDGFVKTLQGPTGTQQQHLHTGLRKVDRGVLVWARQQGVKFQVLQQGETLEEADVLRDLTGNFEQRIDPEKIASIDQHLQELTARIEVERDPKKNKKLRQQKRSQLAELLTKNPSGAAVFTSIYAPLLAPGLSKLQADPTETPTMKSLALHHGADTPKEQKQFYRWLEKLNGPRLSKAMKASITEKSELLAGSPDAQKRWQERAEKNPEVVPLDVTLHTIVVPDAHFFPSHDGGDELLLDRSDMGSIKGWRGGDFRGQWFFLGSKNHVLVRDDAVGLDTAVHELGHVVDITLEKKAPEFYAKLKPRIEKAFSLARSQNRTVTQYSRANAREYIAEGFAAYYNTPEILHKKDPELRAIIADMVVYCCLETGIDPVVDAKLQKVWKDAAAFDPTSHTPDRIQAEFENRLMRSPKVEALSRTALQTTLAATQLGLYTGAAEASLGLSKSKTLPESSLADRLQEAYRNGLDEEQQRDLFEAARDYGHHL